MLSIRDILLPTDFSPKMSRVLDFCVDLALAHKAQLHILHVVEPISEEPNLNARDVFHLNDFYDSAIRAAAEWMDPLVARAIARGGMHPIRTVRQGDVVQTIVEYATAEDIDVLVMPCRMDRVFGASTVSARVQGIIRSAPCPVLTLRHLVLPRSIHRISDIVVAVDFSAHSRLAMEYAVRVAKAYGARLHAINVVPKVRIPAFYSPAGSTASNSSTKAQQRAHDALQYFILEMDILDVPVSTVVKTDDPAFGIADYARELHADLIIMGVHGQSGYSVSGPGNVSTKVISLAATPVFTVRHKRKKLTRGSRMLELASDDM